jgi:hypothetical protein
MSQHNHTHGAAPNALLFVSDLIAEKVLVITATKRLINQKLSTMMQTMKKIQETKNSASIIEYMIGDHWIGHSKHISQSTYEVIVTHLRR